MKAMLLAAGRGERMRPLTDECPKPLLKVAGKPLIVWQIERLVAAGFDDIVINHAWLGPMIEDELGNGTTWGARLAYSAEGEALETLGGIATARRLLGDEPFVLASSDIYTDFDYTRLIPMCNSIAHDYPKRVAHFVLTDNPPYHPKGDMGFEHGLVTTHGKRLNYGNIGVFHPRMFDSVKSGQRAKLFPWAYQFVDTQSITAEHFRGLWENLGTEAQLNELDTRLQARHA